MSAAAQGYRSDIDGLRAIAVVSVLLFHLHKSWLPGGFVGVDIFFVISGYLITKHIAAEVTEGQFSFAEFYRRRIRRIVPMMLVVMAATLAASWLLMTPNDARDVAKSAVWSVASLANVFFWRELDTGYFANSSAEVPLLHYWSLGVEEQYYFLWPALLVLILRWLRPPHVLLLGSAAALLSFALASWMFYVDASFSYYMLPTRAGELLLGSLAGIASARDQFPPWLLRFARSMGLIGVLLIGGSLAFLDERDPFPGWPALPSTLGATLLILAGEKRSSNPVKLLEWQPVVRIGKVSYSAYLWHWPLLALFRYGYGEPGMIASGALVIFTFGLAWLSFEYIEKPTRRSVLALPMLALRQFAIPASILTAVALTVVYADRVGLEMYPIGYRQQLEEVHDRMRPPFSFDWICQRQRLREADLRDPRCEIGPKAAGPAQVLVWGDSNAAHYVPMLRVIADHQGTRIRNVAVGACPPLLADPAPYVAAKRLDDCRASQAVVRDALGGFKTIVISASWLSYEAKSADFLDRVGDLVRELSARGQQVILLGRAPQFTGFDRRCTEKALRFPGMTCGDLLLPLQPEVIEINRRLRAIAADIPNARYFDANDLMCPGGTCRLNGADGWPRYFDASHLSVSGATELGNLVLSTQGVPEALRALMP